MSNPDQSERRYDIVLYGATGYVGRLTAEYLAGAAPAGARIAVAGRNAAKLRSTLDEIAELHRAAAGWDVLVADAGDQASLDAMAAATQVVITTVGPYLAYGLPLVEACARNGTDYADLTGESLFVRDSIDGFHKEAADTGARIVHSCGFDSIPSDLTAFLLHKRAELDGAGTLTDTTLVVRKMRGGASGGTAHSGIAQVRRMSRNPAERRLALDPYTLSTQRSAEPELGAQPDGVMIRGSKINPALPGWTGAFFMGVHNSRIVRRSNALLHWGYGDRFRYTEVIGVGRSPVPAAALAFGIRASGHAARVMRYVPAGWVERIVPQPGTGPSAEARERGHYTIETYTTTTTGRRYVARISQQGDPGYKATAVLLGESGLCLAFDRDRISSDGGVLTPAVAMGEPLADRLRAAGVTLEVQLA